MELMLCVHKDPDEVAEAACEPGLQVRGRAPDHQEVGRIIRRMFAAGTFGEVKLISISEPMKSDKRREVEFELVCTLDAAVTDD